MTAAEISRIDTIGGRDQGGNGTRNTTITGNIIGLLAGRDRNGRALAGNGLGIEQRVRNQIGGTTAAARNVISGNAAATASEPDGGSSNTVAGNYIGTDADGAVLGNAAPASASTPGRTTTPSAAPRRGRATSSAATPPAASTSPARAAPATSSRATPSASSAAGDAAIPGQVAWFRGDDSKDSLDPGRVSTPEGGLGEFPLGKVGSAFAFNGTDADSTSPASRTSSRRRPCRSRCG